MLISWVLRKSIKHSTNLSKKKDKYNKDNLKAVFGLLELLVYIQLATYILLPCNAQVSYCFPLQTCQPLIKENLDTHEKISGDSTKNSEILLFSRLRLIKPCFHWRQSLSVFSKCYLRSFICVKL